jgi:hypothetical protein
MELFISQIWGKKVDAARMVKSGLLYGAFQQRIPIKIDGAP